MRGGTCLHKLHLPRPLRYSEDLDYVRCTRSGIGPYLDAIRRIARDIGLVERSWKQAWPMVHIVFDADSTDGLRRIRVKVEVNVRETRPCFELMTRGFEVTSAWWSGQADVATFDLHELMGTKLRALYERAKGRDLFDLWHVLTESEVDDALIVGAFNHYMEGRAFTYADFAANLSAKLTHSGFASDLNDLVIAPPTGYELATAADVVMERLGSRLAGAPTRGEISQGRWRQVA